MKERYKKEGKKLHKLTKEVKRGAFIIDIKSLKKLNDLIDLVDELREEIQF